MKKTIFTICSIITVCALVIMACKKDDDSAKKVSYANQTTYGTGGNPNPNGLPSTTAVATTSSTGTVAPTYGSFNDGTTKTFTSSTACGSATMQGTYSGGTVILQFPAPPTAGTYTLVTSGAVGNQVVMIAFGATCNAGGIITVTGTTPVTAAFTTVFFNTTTITGSLKCM